MHRPIVFIKESALFDPCGIIIVPRRTVRHMQTNSTNVCQPGEQSDAVHPVELVIFITFAEYSADRHNSDACIRQPTLWCLLD